MGKAVMYPGNKRHQNEKGAIYKSKGFPLTDREDTEAPTLSKESTHAPAALHFPEIYSGTHLLEDKSNLSARVQLKRSGKLQKNNDLTVKKDGSWARNNLEKANTFAQHLEKKIPSTSWTRHITSSISTIFHWLLIEK
jgi:hypothetical protein